MGAHLRLEQENQLKVRTSLDNFSYRMSFHLKAVSMGKSCFQLENQYVDKSQVSEL